MVMFVAPVQRPLAFRVVCSHLGVPLREISAVILPVLSLPIFQDLMHGREVLLFSSIKPILNVQK